MYSRFRRWVLLDDKKWQYEVIMIFWQSGGIHMDNILQLKFLQLKKQPFLHLFPILFLYIFILSYQKDMLTNMDEINILKAFYVTEGVVLVFAIWYQFLDFQIVFYKDLKEISFVNFILSHFQWFIFSKVIYICCITPFLVIFKRANSLNKNSIFIIVLQIWELSCLIYLITQFLRSSLAGIVFGVLYLFVCTSNYLPYPWNMSIIGIVPADVTLNWFLIHGIIILILSVLAQKFKFTFIL